jgi:hypothetical protein
MGVSIPPPSGPSVFGILNPPLTNANIPPPPQLNRVNSLEGLNPNTFSSFSFPKPSTMAPNPTYGSIAYSPATGPFGSPKPPVGPFGSPKPSGGLRKRSKSKKLYRNNRRNTKKK